MERFSGRRFAALLLALVLAASLILPAAAAAVQPAESIPFTEVMPPEDAAAPPYHQLTSDEPQAMSDSISDEPVRALIELEKPSLLEEGYDAADVADNANAQAYNAELEQYQADVIDAIEAAIDEPLDVVWRLTIVADLLSVRIRPAQMEIIAAVPEVRSVQEEAVFLPLEEDESGEAVGEEAGGEESSDEPSAESPGTGEAGCEEAGGDPAGGESAGDGPADITAGDTPATIAESGGPGEPEALDTGVTPNYTGAGQRIAIIDTGVDEWHRSLNSGAWMNALKEDYPGEDLDKYLADLDLLDEGDIVDVLDQLVIIKEKHPELLANGETKREAAAKLAGHGEAETVSGSSLHKIAFGANYSSTYPYDDIAHHERSEHGSHVAGIAAANRYIPTTECWDPDTGEIRPDVTPAYEAPNVTVKTDDGEEKTATVVGQAPNAQLLVMQIFNGDSCAESDYIAAIQDALVLGADTINLSLGSNAPGGTFSREGKFQSIVNGLVESGTVVTMSGGNSSYFTSRNKDTSRPELLYADDVSYDTAGEPGTYDTALAVAAADGETHMADFSSWGVPSTLELKPEITAPGYKIDSLNGAHENTLKPDPQDALHGN